MADATEQTVPTGLTALMHPFRDAFTAPTWEYVLVLVMGAILVPGRRTVASALRVMGRGHVRHFSNYHRVLNRNAWSTRWLSRRLLVQLVDTFVPVFRDSSDGRLATRADGRLNWPKFGLGRVCKRLHPEQ